jgi:rubrerythrin
VDLACCLYSNPHRNLEEKEETMDFESIKDVIRFAIEKEEEAVAFYTEASRQESYSGAKDLFEDFAQEEVKHRTLLEGFLKGEKAVSDYRFEWIPDMKRSDYIVGVKYEKGMSYPEILRLAMKREEGSLALYNLLAKKTEDDSLVKVFKMLSQEEAKHKLALETLYDDFMAAQGD